MRIPWGEREKRIFARLVQGPARPTDLVDALCGDDPDGGPNDAANAVYQVIRRLKNKGHVVELVYLLRR